MASQDFAVLVGIKDYADAAFPKLDGPVRDVTLMKQWLMSPAGGNVPAANVFTIESTSPAPNVPPSQMPPQSAMFWSQFQALVLDAKGQTITRSQSRLYLYFSGHGFSQIRDQMPRASLYTANANRIFCDSIPGTFCAFWTKDAALFKDIVIIMDCCRDAEFAKTEAVPSLSQIFNVGAGANVDIFGIYAAPKGGKAQERPIPSRGNDVHGLLTHAVIDALENAPSDANGVVTSDDICNHIRTRWADICGTIPADPPEFFQPPRAPITLVNRSGNLIPQRIGVVAWAPGEQIELKDGRMQSLARMTRSADGLTVTVVWTGRPVETLPLANSAITIRLAGGLFVLQRAAGRNVFQAGDTNVDI